ncbi:YdcF family protein [Skermania sp. ID1734]|nr:YdcF family protein [Skermania sp. ID1734]
MWLRKLSAGRIFSVDDVDPVPVVIVFGAQVKQGGPGSFLTGRLAATADLVRSGKADVVLASGDRNGESGDEIAAMTTYLVNKGVPRAQIVGDGLGLRTLDTGLRASRTYGVRRALVVSQAFHLPRVVALCTHAGLDVSGVIAECDCRRRILQKNLAREVLLARPKAVLDMVVGKRVTVSSPPDPAVRDALRNRSAVHAQAGGGDVSAP